MTEQKNDAPQRFEEALGELQAIARELEEGALGLDESLRRFEQGIALLRHCYRTLDAAERKISLLTGFDAEGNPVLEPFDATATAEQGVAGRRRKRPSPPPDDACDEPADAPSAERGLF
jgi:exodeoxyribonuclease VII small subunit